MADHQEHEITLHVETTNDGMRGRRIVFVGKGGARTVWYEKKASRKNFWSRHHFTLRNVVDDRILAEYRTKNVVLHRIDHTLKSTYAKMFHSRMHQSYRFNGEDGNEYSLEGHAFTSKLDVYLIDKPNKQACSFLASLWLRSIPLFGGRKRGELTLHEPETLINATGDIAKPTALLDDLLIHCYAYTDVLKAKGEVAVSSTSDSE